MQQRGAMASLSAMALTLVAGCASAATVLDGIPYNPNDIMSSEPTKTTTCDSTHEGYQVGVQIMVVINGILLAFLIGLLSWVVFSITQYKTMIKQHNDRVDKHLAGRIDYIRRNNTTSESPDDIEPSRAQQRILLNGPSTAKTQQVSDQSPGKMTRAEKNKFLLSLTNLLVSDSAQVKSAKVSSNPYDMDDGSVRWHRRGHKELMAANPGLFDTGSKDLAPSPYSDDREELTLAESTLDSAPVSGRGRGSYLMNRAQHQALALSRDAMQSHAEDVPSPEKRLGTRAAMSGSVSTAATSHGQAAARKRRPERQETSFLSAQPSNITSTALRPDNTAVVKANATDARKQRPQSATSQTPSHAADTMNADASSSMPAHDIAEYIEVAPDQTASIGEGGIAHSTTSQAFRQVARANSHGLNDQDEPQTMESSSLATVHKQRRERRPHEYLASSTESLASDSDVSDTDSLSDFNLLPMADRHPPGHVQDIQETSFDSIDGAPTGRDTPFNPEVHAARPPQY